MLGNFLTRAVVRLARQSIPPKMVDQGLCMRSRQTGNVKQMGLIEEHALTRHRVPRCTLTTLLSAQRVVVQPAVLDAVLRAEFGQYLATVGTKYLLPRYV